MPARPRARPTRPATARPKADPADRARYLGALEVIHRSEFEDARAWLDVEVMIGAGGQLVVRETGPVGPWHEVCEALSPDSHGSPTSMRQQIKTLAARLRSTGGR
jgi:hypothetical protein